jgi:hypothetical protein
MKNPLSYQSTEYDCGPTSMLNAINYLFHRKDISPDVIKSITMYCLDSYNRKGEAYKNGTTGVAMMFLVNWLNHFGKVKKWPIHCEMLTGDKVSISQNSKIAECLGQGGVVVARLMLGCWHYVLLTGIDEEYVYLFDPYYRIKPFQEEGIEMIKDCPSKYNRKVKHEVLNREGKRNYNLGKLEDREGIMLFNKTTRVTMDSIEYFI